MHEGSIRKTSILLLVVLTLALLTLEAVRSTGQATALSESWIRVGEEELGDRGPTMMVPSSRFEGKQYFFIPFMDEDGAGHAPAPIWTYDGLEFRKAPVPDGFGVPENNGVFPMVVYQDQLYCGTSNTGGPGQLWRTGDGIEWERLGTRIFTDPDDSKCVPLGVQDGSMLVGFDNEESGARVWAFDGSRFTRANVDGFGIGAQMISCGSTFQGRVHTVAFHRNPGEPLVPLAWNGGREWKATAEPGFGDASNIACFTTATDGNRLCAGTLKIDGGGEAWTYDGLRWSQAGSDGMGDPSSNIALAFPHAGKTLVSTSSYRGGPPLGPSRVYREKPDGTFEEWSREGLGDEGNDMIVVGSVYRGYFIAGTYNRKSGARIYQAQVPVYDTYYFAEGSTRDNAQDGSYEEWICVQNPNNGEAVVTVTCNLADSCPVSQAFTVPGQSRSTISVNSIVGPDRDVSVVVQGSEPIVAERSMYFNYHNEWAGGHVVTGTPLPLDRWYFAEGSTRDNAQDGSYEEWICVQNPNLVPANLEFEYILGDGSTRTVQAVVGPNGRITENVTADVGKDEDVSLVLQSDVGVVAERSMYFDYQGTCAGGHATAGVGLPTATHYFAGGCTYSWGREYVCILNPGRVEASVTLDYQVSGGESCTETLTVEPTSRKTVTPVEVVGEDKDFSVSISSDQPVVAERSTYFDYPSRFTLDQGSIAGGHTVTSVAEPRLRFYFAEGSTRSNDLDGYFEEWLCIQNPSVDEAAEVTVSFVDSGSTFAHDLTVGAAERETLSVNQVLGQGRDAAILIESDTPIVVERPMYFHYQNRWQGGSNSTGLTYQW